MIVKAVAGGLAMEFKNKLPDRHVGSFNKAGVGSVIHASSLTMCP